MQFARLMLLLCIAFSIDSHSAERIKVGFATTLSGPGAALGNDIRDGFQLFLKLSGGTLGGKPADVIVVDDQANPEAAKSVVDRLVKRERVDLMTGMIFSNVLLAVVPDILDASVVYVSPNTGPQEFAGAKCHPLFYAASWQNEDIAAAMGQHVGDRGYKFVYMIAPNYAGGRETLAGFKRTYKGRIDEMYTKFGQLDYAVELAQMRAAKPDAVFMFLPGGMGVNFLKQFVAAGMSREMQLFVPGFSADEDTIRAVGENLLGTINASQWAHDLDNAANRRFVAAFENEYKRLPTMYAAQAYDVAQLFSAAIRDVNGRVEDKAALRKALEAARFDSVRGKFRFNVNHYPIQDYYLRVVSRDGKGRITNRTVGKIYEDKADAFASQCKMR